MSAKDGGPAFASKTTVRKETDWETINKRGPGQYSGEIPQMDVVSTTGGMSLRDYFAAKALPELIALFTTGKLTLKEESSASESHVAISAYAFADAMLAARES